jgi:hypothetical protein
MFDFFEDLFILDLIVLDNLRALLQGQLLVHHGSPTTKQQQSDILYNCDLLNLKGLHHEKSGQGAFFLIGRNEAAYIKAL